MKTLKEWVTELGAFCSQWAQADEHLNCCFVLVVVDPRDPAREMHLSTNLAGIEDPNTRAFMGYVLRSAAEKLAERQAQNGN